MAAIAHEKYVRLTTFTKDGRRKEAPVWIADLGDGTVGFTTELDSWKVKRINHTPTVELTPSNMRGDVDDDATPVTGTAVVVTGADFAPVRQAIGAKYGVQVKLINAAKGIKNRIGSFRGKEAAGDCGIVITLD